MLQHNTWGSKMIELLANSSTSRDVNGWRWRFQCYERKAPKKNYAKSKLGNMKLKQCIFVLLYMNDLHFILDFSVVQSSVSTHIGRINFSSAKNWKKCCVRTYVQLVGPKQNAGWQVGRSGYDVEVSKRDTEESQMHFKCNSSTAVDASDFFVYSSCLL